MENEEEHKINKSSQKEELVREVIRLVTKLAVIAVVLFLVFFVVFGVITLPMDKTGFTGNTLHQGDLLIYFRFNKDCMPGNYVVCQDEYGKEYIGYVAAIAGNKCSYDVDTKELQVNGSLISYVTNADETFTIESNTYLVLSGDICNEEKPLTCSTVQKSNVKGTVFSLIRKSLSKE